MRSSATQQARGWIKSITWRFTIGPLDAPLTSASDDEIDEALSARDMERADLFRASPEAPRHRLYLAYMLANWRIDVDYATEVHWQALKLADEECSRCLNTVRCQRWLEWGRPNAAPLVFCPNAPLWSAIAAESGQAELSPLAGEGGA